MIRARNIHKTFGEHTILHGIDLSVDKGQVVVVLGPSGSGKTTLLRCLNGLEIPEAGTLDFTDQPVLHIDFSKPLPASDLLALRRQSGMVFQQYNLFPHKTALQNVMEGPLTVQKRSLAEVRAEAWHCWLKWAWPIKRICIHSSFRAGSSSVWGLPGRWPLSRL